MFRFCSLALVCLLGTASAHAQSCANGSCAVYTHAVAFYAPQAITQVPGPSLRITGCHNGQCSTTGHCSACTNGQCSVYNQCVGPQGVALATPQAPPQVAFYQPQIQSYTVQRYSTTVHTYATRRRAFRGWFKGGCGGAGRGAGGCGGG